MDTIRALIFSYGSFIAGIVLLCLQIYTYHRTRHYSLALLAAGTAMALLASLLLKSLSSQFFIPALTAAILNSSVILYVGYMILGTWGAAALFSSYCRLTDASKALTQPKAE